MIVSVKSGAASAVRRIVRPSTRAFIAAPSRFSGDVKIQANDPSPRPAPQNVSETNALELDAGGARDAPLQELPEDGEKRRVMQAPNRATKWSPSQQPREIAMSGPRFEQIIMEWQVSMPCAICSEEMGLILTSHDHSPQSNSFTNSQYDGHTIRR